jgi:hypothetical protein
LSLAAKTAKGNVFVLDNSMVEWSVKAAEGSASVDANGLLTVGADSMGVITGRFYVSPTLAAGSDLSAAMSASATFGAENNSIIPPGQPYSPPVTTPDIPSDSSPKTIITEISAKSGDLVSMNLPQGVDGNICVVYCYIGGIKIYVRLCAVIDGKLYFIAPYDAVYYIEENKVEFSDTSKHWAEKHIDFAVARKLFIGVSETEFNPDGNMTRGMFVTVLGRLANVNEKDYATSVFDDIKADSWYAPYVNWAADNGIILGYGNNKFGPDDLVTREQMCVIFKRYLDFAGYSLPFAVRQTVFADQEKISDWAVDAVTYCQRAGLVQGKNNNIFDPLNNLTRAEAATVFERLVKGILKELIVTMKIN